MGLFSKFKPQRDEVQEEILQRAHKEINRSQLLIEELADMSGLMDIKKQISAVQKPQEKRLQGKRKKLVGESK